MRVRRAHALLFSIEGNELVASNFLTRSSAAAGAAALDVLLRAADFIDLDPAPELQPLLDNAILVVEGSETAETDRRYAAEWSWGAIAGLYHFGIRDVPYLSAAAVPDYIAGRMEAMPQVPLYERNGSGAVALPDAGGGELARVLRARRSWRGFDRDAAITLEQLGDCLFAAAGITGFGRPEAPGLEPFPVKASPSGGARNPYEAYVYVQRVGGLARGIYHYSGLEHTLALVRDDKLPPVSAMLGGQEWFDGAAALVILCARFERTMWKYLHPAAYRVVLIEAGHIAQNVLLTAATLGLAAAPTAAITDAVAAHALRLASVTHSVVYAIGLGVRGASATVADITEIVPNERFACER